MMSKKILILLVLVAGFTFVSEAKVPGYLGKKFMLGYNYGLSPVLYGEDHRSRNTSITSYHDFSMGYVISRRSLLKFQYQRSKSGFHTAQRKSIKFSDQTVNIDNPYFLNYTKDKFSLRFNTSLKGAISPMGSYIGFSVYAARLRSHSPNKEPLNEPYEIASESEFYPHYDFPVDWDGGIEMFMGRKFMLTDFMLLDIGVEVIHLNLNFFRAFLIDEFVPQTTNEDRIKNDMRTRDWMKGLVRVYAGVNFLVF